MPVSFTEMTKRFSSTDGPATFLRLAVTVTVPLCVNLMALLARLITIWRSLVTSLVTITESKFLLLYSNRVWFALALIPSKVIRSFSMLSKLNSVTSTSDMPDSILDKSSTSFITLARMVAEERKSEAYCFCLSSNGVSSNKVASP